MIKGLLMDHKNGVSSITCTTNSLCHCAKAKCPPIKIRESMSSAEELSLIAGKKTH